MKKLTKLLIQMPTGYETGYRLERYKGTILVVKRGKPLLILVGKEWMKIETL